jgi:hypothetical protein
MTDETQRRALAIRTSRRKDDDYRVSARRIVSKYPNLPKRDRVEETVRRHIARKQPERVRTQPYASVLKGLCEMAAWSDKQGPVADRATRSLAIIEQLDWSGIVTHVKQFRSLRTRTGRKAATCAPRATDMTVTAEDGSRVTRITTERDLMRVGRALRLCVARVDEIGRAYRARLRDGTSHFYLVQDADGAPIGLVEEDRAQETIIQARGAENEPLPSGAAVVLRRLAAELHITCGDGDGLPEVGLGYGFLVGPGRVVLKGALGGARRFVVRRRGEEVRIELICEEERAFTYLCPARPRLYDGLPTRALLSIQWLLATSGQVSREDRAFFGRLFA